jgi:hypothetical protein
MDKEQVEQGRANNDVQVGKIVKRFFRSASKRVRYRLLPGVW